MFNFRLKFVCLACCLFFISSCGGGDKNPTTGTLKITVKADDGMALAQAQAVVTLFDENNAFVDNAFVDNQETDELAVFTFALASGTYSARIQAQGYQMSPPRGVAAVPFAIVAGETHDITISLLEHADDSATSQIHGNADIAGMLVVAVDPDTDEAVSALTDDEGNYVLFNVPNGDYTITAYQAGYSANVIEQPISGDNFVEDADLDVTENTSVSLSGQVTFLATGNGIVDVTLIHPLTLDTIPGAVVQTDGQGLYALENLPQGDFLAWASYNNDTYVMDPDWIIKNGGVPDAVAVTVADSDLDKPFSVTGAVMLNSPTNAADLVIPAEVDSLTPNFNWTEYSSAQRYVIEVFDLQGNSIWGGWNTDTGIANHTVITSDTLSVIYNFDGSASAALVDGETYIWRITALKWKQSEGKYIAISASEDQMGLFTVRLPSDE